MKWMKAVTTDKYIKTNLSSVKMWCIVVLIMLTCCMAQESYNEIKFTELRTKMDADTIELAREVERLYYFRCDSTIQGCSNGNYHDCLSELPDTECANSKVWVNETCGDNTTSSCSIILDYSTSIVSIPAKLADGKNKNPTDPQVIEGICFTRALDKWFIQKRNKDKTYWETQFNGVHPHLMFFGSNHGSFRFYPAISKEDCTGPYDPRLRPWYIAASSGPKNVVMILDKSGSMKGLRIELLKDAAKHIVETLTVGDRVAIILFDSKTEEISDNGNLYTATSENKKLLLSKIDEIMLGDSTNFFDAFDAAFNLLDKSVDSESAVGCNTAILFLTDGEMTAPDNITPSDVISLVQQRLNQTEQLTKKPIFVFTYSINEEGQDTGSFPSQLSCSIKNSVWSKIDSDDEIVDSLTSYYRLFALGLGEEENSDFTAWVEPYKHSFFNLIGTTVSAPVYDRSKKPALFLGVVGISFALEALNIALGGEGSAESIRRVVLQSTAQCPNINLTTCELESYRQQGSAGKLALCGNNCSDSDFVQVEEEQCPAISDYPSDLWKNIRNADIAYVDRACCSIDPMLTLDQCLSGNASSSAKKMTIWIVGSAVGVALLIVIMYFVCRKRERSEVTKNSDDGFDIFYPPIPPPPPTAPVESKFAPENNSANTGSNYN